MKNIFSKSLIALFVLCFTFTACNDDEDVWPADYSASTVFTSPTEGAGTFFDLVDLNNTAIGFTLEAIGEATVNSADIYKSLNGGEEVYHATVNSLPADITVTAAEAVEGLGISVEEIAVGDQFTFTFVAKTDAGDFKGSEAFSVVASCTSNLAGTYTTVARGTSTDGCCTEEVTDYEGTVTLVEDEAGVYTFNDFSGGIYLFWYEIYGLTSVDDSPITMQDVCGNLTDVGGQIEPFGESVTATGVFDATTGTIELTWSNGWGDEGNVTLTPQ